MYSLDVVSIRLRTLRHINMTARYLVRYVQDNCPECTHLLVTNGDNVYSSDYFAQLMSKDTDIAGCDFYDTGGHRHVKAMMIKSQIDLGAMVFKMSTVINGGITFLSSQKYALGRPKCAWAKDYDDSLTGTQKLQNERRKSASRKSASRRVPLVAGDDCCSFMLHTHRSTLHAHSTHTPRTLHAHSTLNTPRTLIAGFA
jgi:hypothetical protein